MIDFLCADDLLVNPDDEDVAPLTERSPAPVFFGSEEQDDIVDRGA